MGSGFTVGLGRQLGPYVNVSRGVCEMMCTNMTFEDLHCWGYAIWDSKEECYLYFTDDDTFQNVTLNGTSDPFVLYRKQIWHG